MTRVEQLEEKVESLVALLTTQRDVNLASPADRHILTPATTATSPDSGSSISLPRRLSGVSRENPTDSFLFRLLS